VLELGNDVITAITRLQERYGGKCAKSMLGCFHVDKAHFKLDMKLYTSWAKSITEGQSTVAIPPFIDEFKDIHEARKALLPTDDKESRDEEVSKESRDEEVIKPEAEIPKMPSNPSPPVIISPPEIATPQRDYLCHNYLFFGFYLPYSHIFCYKEPSPIVEGNSSFIEYNENPCPVLTLSISS